MTARHRFEAFLPALRTLLLVLLLPGAMPTTARGDTISWNAAAGGDWNTGLNWLGGFVPGPGDVARIALNGSYTVTLGAGTTVAGLQLGGTVGTQSLTITGATLTVNGAATTTATSRLNLVNGAVTGSGTLAADGLVEGKGTSSIGLALTVNAAGTLRALGTSGGAAALTVAGGFTSNGAVELSNDSAGANATLNVTSGSLVVSSGGDLRSLAGSGGGTRALGAALTNQGTFDVSYPLTIAKSGAAHLNSGTLNVSGGDLTVTQSGAGPSFGTSGTITLGMGRTLAVNGGAFNQTAGSVSGATGTLALTIVSATFASPLSTANVGLNFTNCMVGGAALTNAAGKTMTLLGDIVNVAVTNAGTLVMHGSNSLTAGLTTQNGSTLRVEGYTGGSSALTITGNVTNNGTLEMTSSGAAQDATLNFLSGTLTNAPGQTFSVLAGSGGNRTLGVALNNQGQLTVNAPLAMNASAADHVNSGTITLGSGDLTVTQGGATPSFTTSGTLSLGPGRTLNVTGGDFSQSAGTISGSTGTLSLSNATVTLTPGFTAGTCFLTAVGCTLNGGTLSIPATKLLSLRDDVVNMTIDNSGTLALNSVCALNGALQQQVGATLRVEGSGYGAASATIANGFTNNGTIDITTNSVGQNASLTITNGTLVNAISREIKSSVGSGGGSRALNALLDNRGLITVNATLNVARASAAHLNSGTLNLAGGSATFDQGGVTPSFLNSGTVTIGTARTLSFDAGTFTNAAGATLQGGGALSVSGVSFHNAGTIRPGTSPGVLTVTGNLICDPTSALVLELGGPNAGSGYDRLAVSGTVKLDGALQVSLINAFVPTSGGSFNVMQWASHTGGFTSVTGLNPLPDLFLVPEPGYPNYGATGLTYLAVRQAWTQLSPTGTPPLARAGATAVLDAANNRLIVFGGRAAGGVQNDVRVLTNANGLGGAPAWLALSPTGTPPAARGGHSAVYDATNNRMIVFGGDDGVSPAPFGDVWVLTGANGLAGTPTWTMLTPGGTPGARTEHGAAYSAATNRLIIFGGDTTPGSCGGAVNETRVLTNANGLSGAPAWSALTPSGSAPSPRRRATVTYDASGNRLMVYGGDAPCGLPAADAFVLTLANGVGGTPAWSPLVLTNTPAPALTGAGGVYDAAYERVVTFAGLRGDGATLGNDATLLFRANGAAGSPGWALLPPPTTRPAARWRHTTAYDAANHRLIVFGGDTGVASPAPLNDVWVLEMSGANNDVSGVDDPPRAVTPPIAGFLKAPAPNPTRGSLSFTVGTTSAGPVGVTLFDVSGRRIRVLHQGPLPTGPAEFIWDARDDAGRPVSAGVYFVRVTTVTGHGVRRVTILR